MKRYPIFLPFSLLMLVGACNDATPKKGNPEPMPEAIPAPNYLELGKAAVAEAQGVLASKLMAAVKAEGTANAIQFCNVQALVLTDSMANAVHTQLRRVSDRPRNASNQANEDELAYMALMQAEGTYAPKVSEINGSIVGYYPILTNAMCMQCHGKKDTDIAPATTKALAKLYPTDKATGYAPDELRGLWVATMQKN
jgi:nitrate reductase cytochrome c-type subunit